jgi:uncharacterized protein YbjT (DUF2867 family)
LSHIRTLLSIFGSVYQKSSDKEPPQVLKSDNLTLAPVEYDDKTALSNALRGVDVVISTLTHFALSLQVPIAEAALKVGVKLFVPSEFGIASDTAKEGPLLVKAENVQKLRALGIPCTLFYTGNFSDWIWMP